MRAGDGAAPPRDRGVSGPGCRGELERKNDAASLSLLLLRYILDIPAGDGGAVGGGWQRQIDGRMGERQRRDGGGGRKGLSDYEKLIRPTMASRREPSASAGTGSYGL